MGAGLSYGRSDGQYAELWCVNAFSCSLDFAIGPCCVLDLVARYSNTRTWERSSRALYRIQGNEEEAVGVVMRRTVGRVIRTCIELGMLRAQYTACEILHNMLFSSNTWWEIESPGQLSGVALRTDLPPRESNTGSTQIRSSRVRVPVATLTSLLFLLNPF